MANVTPIEVGSVVSLWRYPVKSMMGEELNGADVNQGGLGGDRAYALIDKSDGRVATAKNPRKWPQLFDFRAALADVPRAGAKVPPVHITLPNGTVVSSEQSDIHQVLSKALKREAALSASSDLRGATAEEYWPDMEGLDHRDLYRVRSASGYFIRLRRHASADHGNAGSATDALSARALRGPTVSPQHRGGNCEGRERFRRECLDRANVRDRECGSLEHHWSLRPLLDDDPLSERSAEGCGYPAHGSPAQSG
jgi:hypothetical protein